ncbi:HEXXH motif domain-containing protein [Spongiactinospora sp. TRM90649]|uniref:HEXXH motif domain-containing protein n=1 Tax=Spongiactinospora sp. TRM90649 TaxID=3031114 RepID=UPI0023F69CAD|nr:HEXXH motif domain-containing protein [Spongiactinospora sp. TRM90649]MDF5752618.1 HEXXH motif domain-containing protein [Spongiactinospora sp. TRM90649]
MNLSEHRIPADTFDELASGTVGVETVAHLTAGQHSKHFLLVRGVLEAAREGGHARWAVVRRAYDLLATIQQHDPAAVDAVLRHPSVGAWARHAIQTLETPEQLAAVAAAAAIRARVNCEVDVPVYDGAITLPSLGQVAAPGGARTATVHCSPDGAEVSAGGLVVEIGGDTPAWRGLRSLSATSGERRFDVVIDDVDPHRMPGSANLGGRLGAAEAERWQELLDGAWDLLTGTHPEVADEVSAAISVLTPLSAPPEGLSSATSRDTYGCVALSTPPDARELAVTLAHETQHAKLSALLDIVPLTLPDDGSRYYAPWRDDPRPASGLLQGAYAFLGVTGFWRRQRHEETGGAAVRAGAEFTRWRGAARTVTGTLLSSGRLTGPGERFVGRLGAKLDEWADDPVPAASARLAKDAAEQHLTAWRTRNG